jgi:hypothetical protein
MKSNQFEVSLLVIPREKIDDDLSETMKLLVSFDTIMLEPQTKAHSI